MARKPKRTTDLQRVRNIVANPAVSVLVDHYEDDWTKLWWVRVDGMATVHDTGHGPADRLAGLIPAPGNTSDQRLGLGLWAMHQLDIDVTLRHADNGFTVRLRSGTIPS